MVSCVSTILLFSEEFSEEFRGRQLFQKQNPVTDTTMRLNPPKQIIEMSIFFLLLLPNKFYA